MTMLLEDLEKEDKGYFTAYVSQDTLDKIDALRGNIPRSRVYKGR